MQKFCSENESSVVAKEFWDGLLGRAASGLGGEGFGMRLVKGERDKNS